MAKTEKKNRSLLTDKRAFTLIELLLVMALMIGMMAVAMGGFIDWGRGAGMRTSIRNVLSALVLTRQWTITHRQRTTFTYGNTGSPERGYYVVSNAVDGIIGNTNYLAKKVVFTNTSPESITFKLDGSCTFGASTKTITLTESERGTNLNTSIKVRGLTGFARVAK